MKTIYKYPGPRPISKNNKGLIHKRQATSHKAQAASSKQQAFFGVGPAHRRAAANCRAALYSLDMTKGHRRKVHVALFMDLGHCGTINKGGKMNKFWKVTIYNTYKEYGGPEEGGWYYTAGNAVKYLPRKFSSRKAALEYCKKISHRVDSATVKTFDIPNVRNSYSMFKTYIWFNGSGPEELPVPYYC